MRDLLDAKGVSWKFYAMRRAKRERLRTRRHRWHLERVRRDQRRSVQPGVAAGTSRGAISFSLTTLRSATLPAVSWITPDGLNSDHPARCIKHGPASRRATGRHRAVVGCLDRQCDRREPVLEIDRDRRAVGRLGRLLRPRRAAAPADVAGRPGLSRSDARRLAVRQAARRAHGVRVRQHPEVRRGDLGPGFAGHERRALDEHRQRVRLRACRRAPSRRSRRNTRSSYFLQQTPSGAAPDTQ